MPDKTQGKARIGEEDIRAAVTALMPEPLPFGEDDNLLELGLDSLRLMRLVAQWRKAGLKIAFADLVERPTLRAWLELAGLREAGGRAGASGGTEGPDQPAETGADAPAQKGADRTFPLTDLQHAYWIGRRSDQPLGGVGCHLYMELDALELDPERMHRAWMLLLASHPMLRLRVTADGRQEIMPRGHAESFVLHDLREDSDPAVRLAELREQLSRRVLPVEEGCVAGLAMSLLPHSRVRLHFDCDMLAADARGIAVMLRDLGAAYDTGAIPTARPDWDPAAWLAAQERERAGQEEEDRLYWQERIATLPPPPMLPMRVKPETVRGQRVVRRSRLVPRSQVKTLQYKTAALGATPALAMLTAYAETLARFSESARFTLSLPVSGRESGHEADDMVCDCTTLLLLEADCSENRTFAESLRLMKGRLYEDMGHTSYSGVRVLRDLARLRPGAMPAGSVVFAGNLGSGLMNRRFGPLGSLAYAVSQTPQVWLDFQQYETEDGLLLVWDAADELFPEGLADSMFAAFGRLVEQICALEMNLDSEFDFCDLPANRATSESLPALPESLHGPFFRHAAEDPDRTALILPDGSRLSRGALAGRALRAAAWLKQCGVNEGDIVAVSFPRGADQICAVLAVLAAGAVYVPVSPGQPLPRRERICRKAGIHHALTTHDLAGSMPWPCGVMVLDLSLADSFAGPVPETPARPEPDQSAYIIFTSGSTGEPKGVDIAHEAACATIAAVNARFGIGGEDRALAVSAMDFDLSVYDVFGVLGAGGSLVLLDEDGRRNAQVWGRLLAEHHVTVWNSVPILLDMLLTSAESEGADLSSLRQVLLSGDWIGMDLPARLEQAAPGCGFAALGGATEAAIWSNVQDVTLPLPASWQSIPYGRPLAGQAYRAADCRGRDCPDWVPGELWIGGAGVARGYRGDPELTRKAFVAHGGARWYRTGDMGRFWPDGTIEFLGRRDFQVKVRGHRIELGEIEAAMRSFPGIRDAAVLVVSGASNRRLAAFMTAAGGAAIDTEALRAHLAGLLPDYMVPGAYVELAAMPLSANGKLDRKALAALPVPGGEEEGRTRPSTATERALAELWRTLLGAEEVFAEDTFFELGGDSLLATRLTAEIRSRFGRTLPLEELFLHPSLAGVAEAVDRLAAADSALPERNFPQLTPHPEDAHLPFPLTDIQHAYWIGRTAAYELGNVSSHIFFEFDETGLDAARLEQAWQAMIARHDMLRAVFLPDGTQKILPVAEARSGFAVEDLRGLPAAEADARAAAIRERMAGQVLPAETGPLHEIRVVLLDGEPAPAGSDAADSPDGPDSPAAKKTRARLFMDFDALIADAWSLFLLLDEWLALYRDPEANLPALPVSFRDYVLAEREVRASDLSAADRAYWRARLDDMPMPPELPFARRPSEITSMTTRRRSLVLPAAVWSDLKRRVSAAGLTPSGFLVAAYAEVLARWSKSPRFVLNLTLFNRLPLHGEVNGIVGDFTALDLLAVEDRRGSFLEKARTLQQRLWQDIGHRLVDGVQVLRELGTRGRRAAPAVVFTGAVGLGPGRDASALDEFGRLVASVTQTPQVCLDHQAYEQNGSLVLNWDAVEALFPAGLIDDMFAAYSALVLGLAEGRGWEEEALPALPEAQAHARKAYNASEGPLADLTLADLLARAVREHGERTAVITPEGSRTWAELGLAADRAARALLAGGACANRLIAVVLEKGWEQICAVAGVIRAGSAYLPVQPSVPAERLHLLLKAGECATALTSRDLAQSLDWPAGVRVLAVEDLVAGPGEASAGGMPESADPLPAPGTKPEDLAYVIYTSGSTGTPKGVVIDHRGCVNTILDINERFGVTAEDRLFGISGLHFDLSVYDIWGAAACGAAVVLPDPAGLRDPSHWLELASAHHVSVWNSVPALMQMLAEYAEGRGRPLPDSLRLVLLSGDRIPLHLPDAVRALAKDVRLVSLGGATEASIWSIFYPIGEVDPAWTTIPYGMPLRNQTFYVLDEALSDRPDWVPGELYIGGTGLAKGYWKDPGRTALRFVTRPGTNEPLYRTGDMGRYVPDDMGGYIEFLGREDLQIKLHGYRIELGEIESALRAHEDVEEAVVIVTGEDDESRQLAAFVTARQGADAAALPRVLVEALRRRLPGYMVPARLRVLDALPISGNGKVDRKALVRLVPAETVVSAAPAAEASDMERRVAAVWEEVLEISGPGLEENFFELGGTSLLAVRLHQRLTRALEQDLPLVSIFEYPTIRAWAAFAQEKASEGACDAAGPADGRGGPSSGRAEAQAPDPEQTAVAERRAKRAMRAREQRRRQGR